MRLRVLHNITIDEDGYRLIFARGHREDRYQKGDVLVEVYDCQITGRPTEIETLEWVFETFNVNHPSDYKHRSLSVGDVVLLSARVTFAYWCDSVGWKRIEEPFAYVAGHQMQPVKPAWIQETVDV